VVADIQGIKIEILVKQCCSYLTKSLQVTMYFALRSDGTAGDWLASTILDGVIVSRASVAKTVPGSERSRRLQPQKPNAD
jgi:hypothetical protein